ncbi:ankyrin repeat domain-containing protein [Rhodobacter sp. JA431]|uniref:ankyrin repeat domain-containing protein n=1 Tax=Rhodobacter sp. JA431 TaxID=570013 RepID=UPI001481D224|nr:ankyrin repeat domain-containing protein [Rhodobacter sp. JA431]
MALLAGTSTALAQEDCAHFASRDWLESHSRDQIWTCVSAEPQKVSAIDATGRNLIMKAVGANIAPVVLDDILAALPEDDLRQVLEAKDSQGWSLGHIAARDAQDPGMIFVLAKHGVSFFEEVGGKGGWLDMGTTPLHVAAAREDELEIIAALRAIGEESFSDQYNRLPIDVALAKPGTMGNAVLFADGKWPEVYRAQIGAEDPAEGADCSRLLTKDFFAQASESKVVACVTRATNFDSVDSNGNSLLHLAAANANDPWIVDYILSVATDPGAELKRHNSEGFTPLQTAAQNAPVADTVLHLLAWVAEPNALIAEETNWLRQKRGISALHLAAKRDDDEREAIILYLLAFGADTTMQTGTKHGDDSSAGRTPLHLAALKPDPYIALMMLEAQYSQQGVLDLPRQLLGSHPVKQISDDNGQTVLHMALARNPDFDTLANLLFYGFSVDAPDKMGNTPLIYGAANISDPDLFEMLLNQSENPCKPTPSGTTVEASLLANEALMKIGADDQSGQTLSPLAIFKKKCP